MTPGPIPSRRPGNGLWASLVALGVALAAAPTRVDAQSGSCGDVFHPGQYGPFDYRTRHGDLRIVEEFHFAPQVEALIAGQSTGVAGDLDYTLKSGPNHPRALIAVTRLAERMKTPQVQGMSFSIDCYYQRALTFAPDDFVVRALYAQFLSRHERRPDALKQLGIASGYAKDDGFAHYNLGLVYFELNAYDAAVAEAWRAGSLGFERNELQAMLKRAGKWREPPEAADALASAASASSAAPALAEAGSAPAAAGSK